MSERVKRATSTFAEILQRHVDLSVRAQQAIDLSLDVEIPIAGDLLWGLTKASPPIGEALLSRGFNISKLGPGTLVDRDHRPGELTLKTALEFALLQPDSSRAARVGVPGQPTAAISKAMARGRITELDLLNSLVEVASLSHHSSPSIILRNAFDEPARVDELLSSLGFVRGGPYPPRFGPYMDDQREYAYALADRLRDELLKIPLIDADHAEQQFAFYWDGARVRIAPFGAFGVYQVGQEAVGDESPFKARGNVIHPAPLFTAAALEELEALINRDARESAFQDLFERYPDLLTGLEYKQLYPQWILHEDEEGWLIPDFFLEKINSNFVDLLDLKRPTSQLAKYPRHRTGFTAALHEAVDQLRTYHQWFEDPANRALFRKRYRDLDAYKPRVIIVMGRSRDFYSEQDRIMLERELPQYVTLWTYDDILNRARRFLAFVKGTTR